MDTDSILRLIQIIISGVTLVGTILIYVTFKFNDLKHLADKQDKMDGKVNRLCKTMTNVGNRVAKIEGYLEGIKDKK